MIKKNDLKNLKEFKKDYSLLFNKMSNGFALHKIILDKEGKPCDSLFLEVNPAFEKLTGLKRAEIIGKTALEMLKNLEPYWIDTYSKVALTGKSVRFEHYSQPLGKYYEVNAYSPKKGYFITIFSELENESHIFKRYFEKYLEYASALFLVLDKEGNISLINKKGVELLGYPKEEIIGKNWFMNFLPEEIKSETKKYFMKILRGEVPIDDYYENPVITKSGVKMLRWQNTLLKDASGKIFGILSLTEDLMEKKRIEEQLKYLATIDSLTQIYNKQTGIELLEQGIGGTSLITKTPVTVVFIDANGLKLVNDMYGHIEGDEYLKFLARTLSDCVGEAGTVFRFGGDEFILILPQYDREKAVQLLKKIEDRIEALSSELHKPYKMSISYGLAVFDLEHPVSTDTLLSTADKEMYKMKNSFYKRYRARAEEKLRESEENFRHFLDDSLLGVRIVTAEGETIYANQAILDIYGFNSLEELRTTPVKTRYTPESYVEFKKRYERRQQGDDSPSEYEVNVVRRNGEVRHLLVSRKRQLWNGKKQYQLLYRDITESKKAEAEILRGKALLDRLVETAPESIVLTDNQGTVLRVIMSSCTFLAMRLTRPSDKRSTTWWPSPAPRRKPELLLSLFFREGRFLWNRCGAERTIPFLMFPL
jgi:diguanylate cyclase (GGDEF)-like protein/PAS domain S-box-containing protein